MAHESPTPSAASRPWRYRQGSPAMAQERDLLAGAQGQVWRTWAEPACHRWGWSVAVLTGGEPDAVTGGVAATEAQAKVAVALWEEGFHRHATVVFHDPAPYGTIAPWSVACRMDCGLAEIGAWFSSLAGAVNFGVEHARHGDCEARWVAQMLGRRYVPEPEGEPGPGHETWIDERQTALDGAGAWQAVCACSWRSALIRFDAFDEMADPAQAAHDAAQLAASRHLTLTS
jgi:hypothetical protein